MSTTASTTDATEITLERAVRKPTTTAAALIRFARWPATVVLWALVGFAGGLLLAISAPMLLGYQPLTVLTGSMRPAISPGDIVVDETVSPLQVRKGDIVTFREPESKRVVTHRVRKITVGDGYARIVTQGDANDAPERWRIEADGKLGRVVYRVPKMGHVVARIRTPHGRMALLVIPALLLAAFELRRIWRPQQKEASDAPDA